MADSITSLGASPKYFPLVPNWTSLPQLSFGIARDYISFPGTANLIQTTTALVPKEFKLRFLVTDKDSEYSLLDFLHTVLGRAYRFWIEYPVKQFELNQDVLSGASLLECEDNGFEKLSQGDERIFFIMKNGDLIVRQVTDAVLDDITGRLQLTLDSPTDRDIDTGGYWIFGRFLLCRLSDDSIEQVIRSRDTTEYGIGFTELPYEYSEISD